MYKVVRTALPLLFIAAVYSGGPFYDVFGWGTDWPTWGTLLLITGIANILCACIDRGYRSPRRLAFWGFLLKLCMIPFYTLLFIYATGIATIMFVIPGLFLAAPFVVVPLLAIILMIIHAAWATIAYAKKNPETLSRFHRLSIGVWLVWLVPYVCGMLMGIPALKLDSNVAFASAIGTSIVAGLLIFGAEAKRLRQ